MPATRMALELLATRPLGSALTEISRLTPPDLAFPPEADPIESQMIKAAHISDIPPKMLRDFSRARRLCIDSFVTGFPLTPRRDECWGQIRYAAR